MARTKKQLEREKKSYGSASHSRGCGYPSDPCSCEVYVSSEVRTSHARYCNYPSDPCDCGVN